jgi:hypothetical protein
MPRVVPFLFLFLSATAAAASPALVAEAPTFDFGRVQQGKKVEHVFSFRNGGDEPLTIGKITTSCGCTAATVSASTIAPGKVGEIRAVFDSARFSGAIRKTLSFETNDPRHKTGTFALRGTVVEMLAVRPAQVALGTVKAGTRKEAGFAIENRSDKQVAILSVTSQTPQITASAKGKTAKPGQSVEIAVTVVPRSGDRHLNGYVTIKTDSAAKPEILVPVFATVIE